VRREGALRGVITSERSDVAQLLTELQEFPTMAGRALVDEVTCDAPFELAPTDRSADFHLAVYDFGVKANILRSLVQRGARVTVLPARTPWQECLELAVDGVLLSNGPGDPEPLTEIIDNVRGLLGADLPVFGICLGHQLLGLAAGGRTFKLKFGHHGGNQPVKDLASGRILITSQNHGFAIDPDSLPANCRVTQVNLNDATAEAFVITDKAVVSAQYHPEAAPGPHDAAELFDRFLEAVGGAAGSR
jgi:carbamoyl-phosphate synthase small subunit